MASQRASSGGILNLDRYRTLGGNGVHAFWAGVLVAHALALVSLLFLPETRGKEFLALD